jgi:FAD synthetase
MESLFRSLSTYKLGFAFNGGKESTIVFDMVIKYIPRTVMSDIKFFYMPHDHDFPDLHNFIMKIVNNHDIELLEYKTVKDAITDLKNKYGIDAILMGSRKTDPGCNDLNIFSPTDEGYPNIIRINPIIDWSYRGVWEYIDNHNLEVCSLYNMGYTSIGNKTNTFPNYLLFNSNGNGNDRYIHAKYLPDGTRERIGRIKSSLPITLSGKIIKGYQRGKEIGTPTANIGQDKTNKFIINSLDEGVYYGKCSINSTEYKDKIYNMVMSVGKNIHFNQDNKTVEIHILNKFEKDFYGNELGLNILGYIRPMEKFNSLEELKNAIDRDINICRFYLDRKS